MSSAFDEYRQAMADLDAAHKQSEDFIATISVSIQPLLTNWKRCYIADIGEVSPVLLKGQRRAIRVKDLPDSFAGLQKSMTLYAEAVDRVIAAYSHLAEDEKRLMRGNPPTEKRLIEER
jgi:hypothetical protein